MKLLITAATTKEIQPTLDFYKAKLESGAKFLNGSPAFLITGVGMVSTAFWLGKIFAENHFDLALNMGIAGSFSRDLSIGEVVCVRQDTIADLGAQHKEDFLSVEDLELAAKDDYRFEIDNHLLAPLAGYHAVKAITVNMVHGEQKAIEKVLERLQPDIETMEGAAFHLACKNSAVPGFQIRAISNYVEERNRESWDIPLAVKNLNRELIKIVEALK